MPNDVWCSIVNHKAGMGCRNLILFFAIIFVEVVNMLKVKTEAEKPVENIGTDFAKHIASGRFIQYYEILTTSLVLPELNQTSAPQIKSAE